MAYEKLYGPVGELRADYHAATIAAAIVNIFRGKDTDAIEIEDLLLRFAPRVDPEDMDQGAQRSMVRSIVELEEATGGGTG